MFDHYIAVDWAQTNMAIARMTKHGNEVGVIDVPSDLANLKVYLKNLRGTKALTFEETTTSQWLFTELAGRVDELIVCDPYRNKLLSEGAKTDKIDATKLVKLLRAGLLKEVFHTSDDFIYLRKLVSGYDDLVKAGVRLKNQRSALCQATGLSKKAKTLKTEAEQFVLEGVDTGIALYEKEKARYAEAFVAAKKKYSMIRCLESIPGIGNIGAVTIAALVVDPRRFPDKGHFLSYSGLVQLNRVSGGRDYGSKKPRCCRKLKSVFKVAALSIIKSNSGPLKNYYQYLITEKRYPDHVARNALARRVAVLSFGVMKSGKKFKPEEPKCNQA